MAYATLHQRLRGPIADQLKKELGITNLHALPKIQKVIVNVGINRTLMEGKEMQAFIIESLEQITGQKPVLRESRKAISNFKVRKGLVVGAMVTLRGKKMEEFIDRLISYCLPRIRDFRGLPTKMDGHGNYAIGLKDQTVFPEIPSLDLVKSFGMQIQFSIKAQKEEHARALLKAIGMPFRLSRKEAEALA